jgi:hypothetical protein
MPDAGSERRKLRNQHINFFAYSVTKKLMSRKQSMLSPSKTTRRRAQGMLLISVGFYLSRGKSELRY